MLDEQTPAEPGNEPTTTPDAVLPTSEAFLGFWRERHLCTQSAFVFPVLLFGGLLLSKVGIRIMLVAGTLLLAAQAAAMEIEHPALAGWRARSA